MSEKQNYTPIAAPSDEVLAAIRRKTALSLPDDPSAAGLSTATIRRRFWEAICGADASVLAEMTRIINEANAALGGVVDKAFHYEDDMKKIVESDAEREEIARRAEAAAERVSQSVDGDDVFIRYSAYSDGRDYTATWRRGLNYIGVAVGLSEPSDASGYQWSVLAPGVYVGSGDMPDYADVQIDPDGEGYVVPNVYVGSGPMPEDCCIKVDPGEESEGAISEGAAAFGVNTLAGSWGFRITASSGTSGGTGTYTLEGYESGLEVDDVYTLCIDTRYDRQGKITAISGNVITVDNFVADTLVTSPEGDQNTFRVDTKPEVGNIDTGACAVAFGINTRATGREAIATGRDTKAIGRYAVAMGNNTLAEYDCVALGAHTEASGDHAMAGGHRTIAKGRAAFAHGDGTEASGDNAVTFGDHTKASGKNAMAFGSYTKATGGNAVAFGVGVDSGNYVGASGGASLVAGSNTQATADCAVAFGDGTQAIAKRAMAIGTQTTATGNSAFAGGWQSQANFELSIAFGSQAIAGARASQAFGVGTKISKPNAGRSNEGQMAIGQYNAPDSKGEYVFIAGNGTSDGARSNAFAVKWDGTLVVGGVEITPAQLTKVLALI